MVKGEGRAASERKKGKIEWYSMVYHMELNRVTHLVIPWLDWKAVCFREAECYTQLLIRHNVHCCYKFYRVDFFLVLFS